MMFLNCPAHLDREGTVRCGLPAEVRCRFTMRSTDGPPESTMIRCPVGHCFNGTIESFTFNSTDSRGPTPAGAGSRTEPERLQGSHGGRDGGSGPSRRPNTAPAYYLGRPSDLWINAMRPDHRGSASRYQARTASATTPLPTIWELAWAYHGTNDRLRTPASARDTTWLAWAVHDQWPWGGQ
jgi:hypothetical protein